MRRGRQAVHPRARRRTYARADVEERQLHQREVATALSGNRDRGRIFHIGPVELQYDGKTHIVVVEDDASVRQSIARLLAAPRRGASDPSGQDASDA